jgi:putative addiction module component (TIGR02574 family)
MPPTIKDLGIDCLSVENGFALIGEIGDSLAEDQHAAIPTDPQRREMERRLAAPDGVVPCQEVLAKVQARA